MNSLAEIGSMTFGKEATEPDSSSVRLTATNYCTSEPFKVTQDEK